MNSNIPKSRHVDYSMMFVMLLEKCNFSCSHCIWKDGRLEHIPKLYPGFKLMFQKIKTCLDDCHRIGTIKRVHFSGGEPTLWEDEEMNFLQLLIEVAREGFVPSFITNGSYFSRYSNCMNFFESYFMEGDRKLRIQLTVDTFHNNFNQVTGRAECLDNIIQCIRELHIDGENFLNLEIIAVISKNTDSLIPEPMVDYYESAGLNFIFTPLLDAGKAKTFNHLCPNLNKHTPEDMGAFYPYYRNWYIQCEKTQSIRLWVDEYRLFGEKLVPLGQLNLNVLKDFLKNR